MRRLNAAVCQTEIRLSEPLDFHSTSKYFRETGSRLTLLHVLQVILGSTAEADARHRHRLDDFQQVQSGALPSGEDNRIVEGLTRTGRAID